jgi:signal peptidase
MIKIVRKLISIIGVALVALIGTLFIVSFVSRGNNPNQASSIFGVSAYVVLSDSMAPRFSSGDVIVVAQVDPTDINEGDIITFVSRGPSTFGEIITHQVEEVIEIDGLLNFVTKGINLNSIDPTPVSEQEILGRYVFHIPFLGFVVSYLQTTGGFIILFVLPMSGLILFEIGKFLKYYRLYVKEKIMSTLSTSNQNKPVNEEEKIKALEAELKKLKETNNK